MLVVLLIGGGIVYYEIQWKLNEVEVARHRRLNDLIAQQIKEGGDFTGHPTRKRATIAEIPADSIPGDTASFYTRGLAWNPEFQTDEYKLVVTSFYTIDGRHYRISTYSFIPSFFQMLPSVVNSFKWILLVLLILVVISGGLISKYILAPFKRTMRVIGAFDLKQKAQLRLPGTQTSEFRELNQFLRKMTDKAREDYQSLKEFTENASHELQTPTAIIRGKLDLLMESDIRDEQAILIAEMQNALERLSRIHSSLTLLTKLENQEYQPGEPVRISHLTQETLAAFGELIEMKSLVLDSHIEKDVYILMHASLADLLLTNLISNAIRHNNVPPRGGGKGFIGVQLTKEGLVIVNTGVEPRVPTQELFERFKKGNSGSDSIGIGLAIVRQICELSHFDIVYQYAEGMHRVAVAFRPNAPASRLLQDLSFALHLS